MFKIHITYSVVFKMSICLFIGKVLCDGRPYYQYGKRTYMHDFMHGKWNSNEVKRVRRALVVYVGIFDFSLFWIHAVHGWICGCHMPGYICLKVWVKEWCGFSYTYNYMRILFTYMYVWTLCLCDCDVDCFQFFFFICYL